jgi:hypothetical protein
LLAAPHDVRLDATHNSHHQSATHQGCAFVL